MMYVIKFFGNNEIKYESDKNYTIILALIFEITKYIGDEHICP
jgi:hypothetical protein